MVSGDSNIITTLAAEEYPARVDGHLAVRSILNYTSGVAVDRSGNFFFIEVDNHKVRMVDRKSGIVTTVAGNGEAGFSGDGGLATEAMLNSPNGIALDSAGHLYIADGYNNRIRKVDVATGIISTIAGEGSKGFSGDGGLATEAMLNSPYGVAVDDSNNLYITDKNNLRIRKIDRDGIITTVAGNGERGFSGDGGLATEAMLDFPYGIAVDQSGYLYFVDRYNNRIRKVDLSTGIITTAAGNGTQGFSEDGTLATEAQLTSPQNIAVDRLGNLFISDLFYHRVRRVDQKSGLITTVAGSGQRGFAGDSSLAIEAELNSPVGIAVDRFDNLYIADAGNHRIRMVELDPALSIFTHHSQLFAEMRYDSESASLLLRSTKGGQLIVTDLLGNLLLTKAIEAGESRFDLSHLPRGRYFAQCGGAVEVITKGR
jgi:DNA-binding beta-propeller fold protein YncE